MMLLKAKNLHNGREHLQERRNVTSKGVMVCECATGRPTCLILQKAPSKYSQKIVIAEILIATVKVGKLVVDELRYLEI